MSDVNQYPRVRALTACLACGGGKREGLLICWECHNTLKMQHDYGYGPIMDRVISVIDARLDRVATAAHEPKLPDCILQALNERTGNEEG